MLNFKVPLNDMRFVMNEVFDYPAHYRHLGGAEEATPSAVVAEVVQAQETSTAEPSLTALLAEKSISELCTEARLRVFERGLQSLQDLDDLMSRRTDAGVSAQADLTLVALGVGPGDLVWTSPITFVATANCARYCGADVDFVDIDPRTFNLCPQRLAEKLERARVAGRLPKVVIPVHMCGQPCDMAGIHVLAQEYGFRIIEDASHAIGARHKGERIGSGRYSDITIFSFHPVKHIATGEGGMVTTDDPDLAERMRRFFDEAGAR